MKKKCLFVAALACAVMFTAGIASAKTPVAGFSPSLANPQPVNDNVLATDANRLIRWQGWLDVDAFSASVLEQMQTQLDAGVIETGKFDVVEPAIAAAVYAAKVKDPLFKMNEELEKGNGVELKNAKFYVWLYRHNYTDTGLYQLYVSVTAKVKIGEGYDETFVVKPHPYNDIQSLGYEFGPAVAESGVIGSWGPIVKDIEIWRGAVVRVNARGRVDNVGVMEEWDEREFDINGIGNIAGVIPGTTLDNPSKDEDVVLAAPISDWEVAPVLPACHNPGGLYIPLNATGPKYKVPVDLRPVGRVIRVGTSNGVQKQTGEVQEEGRVRTLSYPQAKPSVAPRKRGHGK